MGGRGSGGVGIAYGVDLGFFQGSCKDSTRAFIGCDIRDQETPGRAWARSVQGRRPPQEGLVSARRPMGVLDSFRVYGVP